MKSPPTYNEWDLKFIKGAYLSHTEVTRMLRRTSERTDNVHVRTLATGLLSVRAGELQMLSSWLADWDMPRPKSTGTDKATQGINKLSGTDYDKKLLAYLLENQRELLRLATQEQESGTYSPARRLAERTVQSSTGLIANMSTMADNLTD